MKKTHSADDLSKNKFTLISRLDHMIVMVWMLNFYNSEHWKVDTLRMALNILNKSLKLNCNSLRSLGIVRSKSSEPSWVPNDSTTHTGQVNAYYHVCWLWPLQDLSLKCKSSLYQILVPLVPKKLFSSAD